MLWVLYYRIQSVNLDIDPMFTRNGDRESTASVRNNFVNIYVVVTLRFVMYSCKIFLQTPL